MKDLKDPETRINHQLPAPKALSRILRYCAYQERSHGEVRNRLFQYGLPTSDVDKILSHLITEGFLNEERYARAFVGGKFRMMKWGKIKIQRELETLGVSPRNINCGLREISASDYSKTICDLIKRKTGQVSEDNLFKKKNKVARFVIGKGFEPDLVWDAVNSLVE